MTAHIALWRLQLVAMYLAHKPFAQVCVVGTPPGRDDMGGGFLGRIASGQA